ncbi:hypothetical protein D8674_034344 [Pyrus ussuriensis x Pyrus communis]|uniref:Uncharacterized protein n=1 Tax=Pyrus ussuriensis x Pyrus communis TaxID=2448454 RepID=A0A5N5HNR4_9ROSA|nr:hypothetical protein D8674_034344 [Pyrus ussuriensis x Pyrus communis]
MNLDANSAPKENPTALSRWYSGDSDSFVTWTSDLPLRQYSKLSLLLFLCRIPTRNGETIRCGVMIEVPAEPTIFERLPFKGRKCFEGFYLSIYCKMVPEELKKSMVGELSKKARANKINREKKTIFHHSGLKPFSYRMEAQRQGGSKFSKINVFADVYVRPGDELVESLHYHDYYFNVIINISCYITHVTMMEKRRLVRQEFASQLSRKTSIESVDPPKDAGFQILIDILDQTFRRRQMRYCRGMGNA